SRSRSPVAPEKHGDLAHIVTMGALANQENRRSRATLARYERHLLRPSPLRPTPAVRRPPGAQAPSAQPPSRHPVHGAQVQSSLRKIVQKFAPPPASGYWSTMDHPTSLVRCANCAEPPAPGTTLRRGRCLRCYDAWVRARPVGIGASCAACENRRRAQLRYYEMGVRQNVPGGRWIILCWNCAALADSL